MSTEGFLPFPEDESESEESPGLAFTHVQPEYEQTRHTSNNDQIVPPESPGRGREVLERGAAEECQRLVSNQSSVNLKSRKSLAESQRPMDPSRNFKERPKRETQASMEDAEHENQELKIVNQKLKEKIRNLKIKEREIQAGERELQLKKEEHTWQVECHQSEIILQAQELSVRRKKLQLDREEKLNKEEYTVQVERRQSDIKLQAQELSLRREKLQLDEKELEIQERRFSLGNHLQRLLIANENLREENQRLKSEVKKLDRQIYILAHPIRPEQETQVTPSQPVQETMEERETGGYLPPPTITLHPSHTTVAPGGCAVLECQAEETGGYLPPPTITLHPSHITVAPGGCAVLECQAEGEGLIYNWNKDGRQFHQDRHGKLITDPVGPENLGEYCCEVVNDGGKIKSSPAKVVILTITELPKDRRGQVGDELAFSCIAKGHPEQSLVYQWFQKQPGGDEDTVIEGKGSMCYAKLIFTPRLKYRIYCRVSLAENQEVAVNSKVATVHVDSIRITQQPQSIDCHIGDSASLTCHAESYQESAKDQKITYVWLKSDTLGSRRKHVLTCDSGVLPFDRLGQRNWGYYICQAQNDYQKVQSEEVYVKVAAPPTDESREKDLAHSPIRFTKHPWSQVVPLGGNFRLLCEAHSTEDEPLHYQWYFNGLPLDGETGDKLIRERVLNSHIGNYFCEVRTNEGLTRSTSTARIEQAPLPPPPHEESHRVMSGVQLDQQEAERILKTVKEERYAREKVALLIGNQRYECKDRIQLNSPENNTRDLAKMLHKLNFKVFSFVNLNFREMMDALEVFYEMLTLPGIYALFYYTGHGFSHKGVTYLMPVDATFPPRCDYNIAADDIGAHMQNKKSRAVKILDCCQISDQENIESATQSRTVSLGYSNILEITSCQSDHASYESREEPNSTFNVALRGALDSKRKMFEVLEQIQDKMCRAGQSLNGRPYQRPKTNPSLADYKITLHDEIMLDDPAAEEKLYEIGHKWKQAHTLPEPVVLTDELEGLLSVKLNFSADFSNVLVVEIILIPAGSCTSATVDADTTFLESQGLRGEVYSREEAPSNHPTATLKVADLQRLKGNLKLCLKVSVTSTEPGRGEKKGTVVHELDQRPLFANKIHLPK